MIENLEVVDGILVGHVKPRIYAFSTNTVPNSLKVGDTYRPVSRRLQEWRRYYPDLEKQFDGPASVSDDVYFRDHSVHKFLETDRGRPRLLPVDLDANVNYSREFFRDAQVEDVERAINDIIRDHDDQSGRYVFFDPTLRLPAVFRHARGQSWDLRPNQQEAVDRFASAVGAGRTDLLMYAVMRYGKTFTSLMCAKSIAAETVLVVSAKADVRSEWKQTVESAGNFDGSAFLDAEDLLANPDAIADARGSNDMVVVFLTLQDLQGAELKEKHAEIFSNDIDLLIIDETHFGARAEEYGKVLRSAKQPVEPVKLRETDKDDQIEVADAEEQLKILNAKLRLHLSGSPYRILMGSEFAPEDIIAFVQFADIVREQEEWDRDNPDENEWKNPYFGFPQMVRFAFNPNQSSRDRLEELRKQGVTFAFHALLEPHSVTRDAANGAHKSFINESEILDLLRVIDGTKEDDNVLGFLDYDRVKEGRMCRHMVMVLPYRASCDAMQALIVNNAQHFKHLRDYEIINISGVDDTRRFRTPEDVKRTIAHAESEGRKTLTLTVNRMLTGSTVEQWDTMLYLKDTASPQEYDQATFRLQSQHVRVLSAAEGDEVIKENLKPQTLLVDFDPMRMFRIQEQRSLISNVNDAGAGNAMLEERLRNDLRISPIITINNNQIRQVEATSILEAVSAYNMSRSIADEARDVPVDLGLLEVAEILAVIEAQAELGSRGGLTIQAVEGEEVDLDTEVDESDDEEPVDRTQDDPGGSTGGDGAPDSREDIRSLQLKLQTYYQRLLFFALLAPAPVRSLDDVINAMSDGENPRIAKNLGLEEPVLRAILAAFDPFKLSALDYKIQNISRLARESSLSPTERASRALEKFSRISDSEVRTPSWLCKQIVDRIPGERLKELVESGEKLLDIASKAGEFAVAFYDRLVNDLEVSPDLARSAIYSVPTSGTAYEFTRRFYEILGLDVANILVGLTAYDLVASDALRDNVLGALINGGSSKVKFGAVVGNPPYQENDGGAQASARPIYPQFIAAAESLKPEFMSFVIPTRWYTGGKQLGEFRGRMLSDPHIRELNDFVNPEEVFPGTNNRGGVCYFLWDRSYESSASGGTRVLTRSGVDIDVDMTRPLDTFGLGIFLRDSKAVAIVEKIRASEGFASFEDRVSGRRPFGLAGNIVSSDNFHEVPDGLDEPILCYGKSRRVGYVEDSVVRTHREWISHWKVLAPYANNIGTELNDDNQNAFVAPPGSACSETFLVMGVGLELSEASATNLTVYLKSRFARFLHAKAKISQHGTKATYRFVPTVDVSLTSPIDWSASANQVDEQLFNMFALSDDEREHIRSSIKAMK